MPHLDWEIYRNDESAVVKNYQFTAEQDAIARKYQQDFISNKYPHLATFLSAINNYGPSCLDVGCAYGAQYFALKENYPNVIWTGMEVSDAYRLKTDDELEKAGAIATVIPITSYKDMTLVPDNSFDCVTSRSFLKHYAWENAQVILEEMYRIARKAVIVLFSVVPDARFEQGRTGDFYTERTGIWDGIGFAVEWSAANWEAYKASKVAQGAKVFNYEDNQLVVVIEKPQAVRG